MPRTELPFVICLAGPTGSGKTALAIDLVAKYGCEIINADSRQVYAAFPIITAQPGPDELRAARHHLYGFLPVSSRVNVGQWLELVLPLCREIRARGKTPLLVGGTGFYFQALLCGLSAIPAIPGEIANQINRQISLDGPEPHFARLCACDPLFAASIHRHDRQRIQRGLEVFQATGKPLSWWHQSARPQPYARGPLLYLATPLADLMPRLGARIKDMLANGAIAEAKAAWRECPDATAPGWNGIGCAELLDHICGATDIGECGRRWLASTRAYARRQITWFRGRENAISVEPDSVALIKGLDRWRAANHMADFF